MYGLGRFYASFFIIARRLYRCVDREEQMENSNEFEASLCSGRVTFCIVLYARVPVFLLSLLHPLETLCPHLSSRFLSKKYYLNVDFALDVLLYQMLCWCSSSSLNVG